MKGFLTFRGASALALVLAALAALVSVSCRIPFGIGAKGGISSLSVSIRVPAMPSTRASTGSGSRLITAYTTSIAITLSIPGEAPIHQEKAPDSDGLVSFTIDAVPANLDITVTTEASDASGVYSRNVTTRRFSPGPNALPIVLLPTGAIAMPVGYGAASLAPDASAIYQVTATKAGDWTVQLDGSYADSEAWGPDGRPIAGFIRGTNSLTIPGMAIGQSAFLAVRANSTGSSLSSHFYRAATGILDATFGSAGLAAASGDGVITDENITDICLIDGNRIAVVGSYKTNLADDATQRGFLAIFKNGTLDTSFNSDNTPGWIVVDPSMRRSEACACAFQSSSSGPCIVVAGRYENSSAYQYYVWQRNLDDGSTIGLHYDPNVKDTNWAECYPPRLGKDSSGSLFLSTYNNNSNSLAMEVRKIQTSTSGPNLDTSFGASGNVTIATGRFCTSLALDGGNLFIASQSTSATDFGVTRILASGAKPSANFGGDALMAGTNNDSFVVDAATGGGTNYASGKIVISSASGTKSIYLTGSRILPGHSGYKDMALAVIRYTDGTPLYTTGVFDATGVWTANHGIAQHLHAFDVVVDSGGNMNVFGGNVDFVNAVIVPVHASGSARVDRIMNAPSPYLDQSRSSVTIDGAACITSALPSSDGNIAAGGYATESQNSNDVAFYSLSPSASNTLSRWSKPLSREACVFNDVAVQRAGSKNGYIVAVGTLNGNKGIVACFTPEGKPDLSFNGTGRVVFDNGTNTTTLRAVAVDKNGDIYAAGDLDNGTLSGYLVHLTSSGGLSSGWKTINLTGPSTLKAVAVSDDSYLYFGGTNGAQAAIFIYDPLGQPVSGTGTWTNSAYVSVDDLALGKDKTLHATLGDSGGLASYFRASLEDTHGFYGSPSISAIGSEFGITCNNAKVVLDEKGTAYTVSTVPSSGNFYPFVRLYASGTNPYWYRGFTGLDNPSNSSFGIGVHPNGTVFISGNVGTTSTKVQSYIATINSNGELVSSNAVPNSESVLNQCAALAISPSGSIVVAGDVGDTGTNGAVFVFD
jgi:hypothetical protein